MSRDPDAVAHDVDLIARELRAALVKVPYHKNPKLPEGSPFGYPPEGHREYSCHVCIVLDRAEGILGPFDYEADPDYQAELAR